MNKVFGLLLMSWFWTNMGHAQYAAGDNQVLSTDGAWCWFSDPRAVHHKGERERIYYGYITSQGDVVIGAKDLSTAEVENVVLHEKLQVDDHNVPSILILPDGRLLVFYTEHNGRFFTRTSKNPESITTWEDERVIPFGGTRITYSHPVMLAKEQNRIYVFWRGSDWQQTFAFSDDLGETWSKPQVLIASDGAKNRPYLKVSSDGQSRIDFIFTDGHPGVEATNSVYHVYYDKGVFYQTGGDRIVSIAETPFSGEDVHKAYDGTKTGVRGWIWDVALNRDGHPVICYTRFPKDTDHRYHYAYWDGKQWLDEEICKAGGWMPQVAAGERIREPHYSGGIVMDHANPENVYLSRETDDRFEIEHWEKRRGGWHVTPLTQNSDVNNIRPYAVSMSADKRAILLWMSGYYGHYTRFATQLHMASP